ncbi:hypothetical protein SASPL_157394 [Salvia splendens]|uniref:Uncharacterized protein n=1 Tax=Salvia splendens TaxID=180675 RepID=A0A8X8VV06_SALSN|nr:hypothetical protein SASPL_157394 [Salvia splendens]
MPEFRARGHAGDGAGGADPGGDVQPIGQQWGPAVAGDVRVDEAQTADKWSSPLVVGRYNEMSFILSIVGCPILPFQIKVDRSIERAVKHASIVSSSSSSSSVRRRRPSEDQRLRVLPGDESVKTKSNEQAGGFVLWQKNPDKWCLEMLISGSKIISGSNGKLSWRQSSNQLRPISKGPPRLLRRFLQGLDPRAAANLFIDAVCIGEKIINDEDCFILKIDTNQSTLEAQSSPKHEIIHHTIWGYFSQRSGLLVKLEDSRLLSVKTCKEDGDVFWETSTESVIEDYKLVDGVNIAHGGKTFFTVFRYGNSLQTTNGSCRRHGNSKRLISTSMD